MGFFLTLLLFAAFFVLSEILKPNPNEDAARPANLGDFQFPTATEGRVVPLIWGTVKIKGPNVVWYGDLTQDAILSEGTSGLFGLFSTPGQTIGFQYNIGIQFALCRGPVDTIHRIWIGEEVVFSSVPGVGASTISINSPELFGGNDLGQGGVVGDFSFLEGTQIQVANPYLSTFQQEGGITPGYVGTCYGVFESGYIGNSTQIKPWAFELRRIPDGLGLGAAATVNGNDANPANVLFEMITNTEWGLGQPVGDIDTANFVTAGNTLSTEGNGFSFILDRSMEIATLLREVERQIDGLVILNRSTGRWQINLARGGYDIDLVPQVTDSNVVSVEDFARGAWEDTANVVQVNFADRSREYQETYALAQDMANIRIQSVPVPINQSYPGVKDKTLANNIAWRDLRGQSFPLSKVKLVVDRTFYAVNPGDVIAWTNAELGFVKQPMRIIRIDLGELESGQISLDTVQDIFEFAQPSFADPGATGWTPPADNLVAFPADEQLAFEAPNAFIQRDPTTPGVRSRVWAAGRNQGDGAVVIDIKQRNASGVPSGTFFAAGTITGFMLIGDLVAALDHTGDNDGVFNFLVDADPDTQLALEAAIPDVSDEQIGLNLANLLLIGTEFFACKLAVNSGGDVQVQQCWRALLDTAAQDHAIDDHVFLCFVGGGLTTTAFPPGNQVDIKLLTRSTTDQLAEGSAVTVNFTLADRDRKPYPPVEPDYNSSRYATTANVDTNHGTDLDDRGIEVAFTRRDFRTADEVAGIQADGSTFQADFPAANTTEYAVEVTDDPDGTPTLLFTTPFQAASPVLVERTEILNATDGVLTSRLRLRLLTRHTFENDVLNSIQTVDHDLNTTYSGLANDLNMGALDDAEVGTFTAPVTGTYTFTIGTDVLTSGAVVEAQINGGGFATVISTGATTGTLAGVTAADTIDVRHTQLTGGVNTFLEVDAPSGTVDAYAILIT